MSGGCGLCHVTLHSNKVCLLQSYISEAFISKLFVPSSFFSPSLLSFEHLVFAFSYEGGCYSSSVLYSGTIARGAVFRQNSKAYSHLFFFPFFSLFSPLPCSRAAICVQSAISPPQSLCTLQQHCAGGEICHCCWGNNATCE